MITLKNKAAIEIGAEAIYKSQELTVNYETYLDTEYSVDLKQNIKVGKIKSYLINEDGRNITNSNRVDNDKNFLGKDILGELHKIYIAELKALNPILIFTDTYNK
jgi:hypothetical protein